MSASQPAAYGSVSLSSNIKDLKTIFTVSLLDAQHLRGSLEKSRQGLLAMFLSKADKTASTLCGRQMMEPSSLPVAVAQSDEDQQTEHELIHGNKLALNQVIVFKNGICKIT